MIKICKAIAYVVMTTMWAILAASASAQSIDRTQPAEDMAASAVDPDWEAPRTFWGHPSFEGVWSIDDMRSIPRQRPEAFGTREKLTSDEFAERAASDASARAGL